MALSRYTRLIALTFLAAVVLFVVAMAAAWAQETTSVDDPLTRYDDALVTQLQADYDRLKEEEAAYLEENPSAGFYEDDEKVNDLADARMRAISNVPEPEKPGPAAEERRRQAESLYALQSWADSAGINVNSNVYSDGAELLAEDYEDEADDLEAEAEEEKAAQEEKAAPEERPETTGAAAASGDGGNKAEGQAEAIPDEAPEASGSKDNLGGPLDGLRNISSGFSLTSLLAAGLIAIGVSYYIVGLFREGLKERVKSIGSPQQARAPKPRERPREAPPQHPGAATAPSEESQDSGEGREAPSEAAKSHAMPEEKPLGRTSEETDASSPDAEHLAEWFAMESPEPEEPEKKEARREGRRRRRRGGEPDEGAEVSKEAPGEGSEERMGEVPKTDVNRIVAEEVARMREAGELAPDDEVEVRVVDGRITVRRKE